MENKEVVLTFTVAECGEYHNLGEYHEGIRTLEEAISVYKKIPPERMNGNPQVQEAVKEIIRLFPDKEVIDY